MAVIWLVAAGVACFAFSVGFVFGTAWGVRCEQNRMMDLAWRKMRTEREGT